MTERMRGHVQQFSHQRRSGLVQPDNGYPVIWLFQTVEFKVEQTLKGPKAVDVVILGGENDNVQSR